MQSVESNDELSKVLTGKLGGLERGRGSAFLLVAYAFTIFISAFLLFQVQPLIAKFILPWFGGTPGMWTVCILFFQATLFAGYAYAHVLSSHFRPRTQSVVHAILLVAACLTLPIIPAESWKPVGSEWPELRVMQVLLATVGIPFFVLSSTGPLLQAWFSRTHAGRSPYRLYALSNVGSLIALVSYPFVFDWLCTRRIQAQLWSGGFVAFAIVCGICGLLLARHKAPATDRAEAAAAGNEQVPATPRGRRCNRCRTGAGLAVVVVRLGDGSVCAAFGNDESGLPGCGQRAFLVGAAADPVSLVLHSLLRQRPLVRTAGGDAGSRPGDRGGLPHTVGRQDGAPGHANHRVFSALFRLAMVCHGELSRLRPQARHLTAFYLLISAGGAARGIFVAIIAPLILKSYFELRAGTLGVRGLDPGRALPR